MSKFIFPKIAQYCEKLLQEQSLIAPERKEKLQKGSDYIRQVMAKGETAQLIVICTHNSRRSHLGQLWLAVGADFLNLPRLATFSGGTEATAFNPRAVKALDDLGFEVVTDKDQAPNNPLYKFYWTYTMSPYEAFSKKYTDAPNPNTKFGAILVCSEADEGCPLISGADFRLALPFEDPKAFDGTELEATKYKERCQQIGREMLYLLSKVGG